jgi:diadenosine tetraphosphatase ApaH/serine/threonine PP2A family protein phosphatase
MQLRGTSGLFRSTVSPLQQIRLKRCYESIQLIQVQNQMTGIDTKKERAKGTCQRCCDKRYTIAAHTVRLASDGTIVDPQDNKNQSDLAKMPRTLRKMSDTSFLGSTNANIIVDNLRTFADVSGLSSNRSSNRQTPDSGQSLWASKNSRTQLFDKVMKICSDAESLLKKEPRVVKVSSPCYVLGDIHGNFHDLIIYEKVLWKMGPTCVSANYLFLGDYVDRGEHGLECILYLLSNKLLAPERYWLLRGNHELRTVQQQFTFHRECQDKFGIKSGLQIWEALNKVFDLLPICAIIDDSIFCSHGGIPTSVLKVEELMKIPCPMNDPENQSPSAWEMLWNDPVSNQEFTEFSKMLREQSGSSAYNNLQGFLPNTKRGTAYYFSEDAVNKFLAANGLSHVIRAHEVIPSGYQFHMGGKVITVFSSSKYCGGLNESACALVDMEKIRIIKVDTN